MKGYDEKDKELIRKTNDIALSARKKVSSKRQKEKAVDKAMVFGSQEIKYPGSLFVSDNLF